MKILSAYFKDHEISVETNLLGKQTVYYDGNAMSSKWNLLGGSQSFTVIEFDEEVSYSVTTGFNNYGILNADIWRNEQPLVLTLYKPFKRPKRPLITYESDFV